MSLAFAIGVRGESRAVLGLTSAGAFLLPYRSQIGNGVVLGVVGVGGPRCVAVLVMTFLFPYRSQIGSGLVAGVGAVGAGASFLWTR